MLAQDVRPSRIERAKAELTQFISELGGDRIGLVAFAGETMTFPMTIDYAAAALFFRELGPYDMPVGGTAIGRALTAAKRLLERSTPPKGNDRARVVILMTDGEDHEGDPVAAAKELAEMGAQVFVVALGSRSGEAVPTYGDDGTWTGYAHDQEGNQVVSVLSEDAEARLREIADVTGGQYIAPRRGDVGMHEIRAQMQRMKQSEIEARRVTVHEERYALVLLLAFLLVVLEALLPEARAVRGATMVLFAALVLTPTNAQAQFWKDWLRSRNSDVEEGNRAMEAGDANAALQHYDEAARALPRAGGVQLNRGLALLAQADFGAAREAFRRATEPPADKSLRADAHHNLGVAFFQEADGFAQAERYGEAQKAFADAADAFRQALRTQPGRDDTAWNLELAVRRMREAEEKKEQQQEQQQDQQDQQDPQQDQQDPQQQDQQEQDQQQQDQQQQDQQQDQQQQDPQQQDQQEQDQQEQDQQQQDQQQQDQQQQDQRQQDQQQQQQDPQQQQQQQRQATEQPGIPAEVERALDALQDGEQNLERLRALRRGRARRVEKDW
jgi:Ca-activated chloride channel family protein